MNSKELNVNICFKILYAILQQTKSQLNKLENDFSKEFLKENIGNDYIDLRNIISNIEKKTINSFNKKV